MLSDTIQVTYEATSDPVRASQMLSHIESLSIAAFDFEAAVKYTPEDIEHFKAQLENSDLPYLKRKSYQSKAKATALSHPSHTQLTHLSIAWSESEAYVIILDTPEITDLVLNFLVTTDMVQIWHNLSYDAKHIVHRTGQFPKNYEDTQIFAKTLINHVDTFKAKTGLKELAGEAYGSWAISPDLFDVSQMYEENVLKYAATDACATMWCWNKLQSYVKETPCP